MNYALQLVLKKKVDKQTLQKKSFILITLSSVAVFSIVFLIRDPELANRFQHAIAGGFLTMLISYLAFKDSQVEINKLQIILLSVLVVTFLGVLNEILEFIIQINTNLVFADNLNDTWLDLTSNFFGIMLGNIFALLDNKIKK
ncbi:MAG: hypothetical protein PHQ01_01255 [Candidatus Pacebacteria bacterium]|nr:hypothetical protein [Candidatus Paceibacterota bacterium]